MSNSIHSYKHNRKIIRYREGFFFLDEYSTKKKGQIYKRTIKEKCRCDWCMPVNISRRKQGKASDRARMLNNVSDY